MSDHSKFFQSGARALTGLLISAVAATGVVLLGVIPFPTVERAPHAVTVDTKQTNERELVCAGAFAELGADPARPDEAVPIGEPSVVVAGDGELSRLATASVFAGSATSALAAAQTQRPSSATLSGLVASSCVEPSNEQWLVGGGTTLGLSTTLNLANATDVAATVQVSVFDDTGEIADFQTAGVIVAPNSEQIVSLNGYAPDREGLAVRVTSTGAPVAASLGVARVEVLQPSGTASVTRQLRATTQLVFPGITNVYEHEHEPENRPGDAGPADIFPVRVQAITPGGALGTAFVYAVNADGVRTELGEIELHPKTLGTLQVTTWPSDATALVIDADVPIFGAAEGSSGSDSIVDFDWFSPAPGIAADTEVAAAVAPGGALFIANTGGTDAEVTIVADATSASGDEAAGTKPTTPAKPADAAKPQIITVPAGSAVQVDGAGSFTISSTAPIHAGVRIVAVGTLAGYPIAPLAERGGELTVYTR